MSPLVVQDKFGYYKPKIWSSIQEDNYIDILFYPNPGFTHETDI